MANSTDANASKDTNNPCPRCDGAGHMPLYGGFIGPKCKHCNGTGQSPQPEATFAQDKNTGWYFCPECRQYSSSTLCLNCGYEKPQPEPSTTNKVDLQSDLAKQVIAATRTRCHRPGCKVKHRAKTEDYVKQALALIETEKAKAVREAVIEELQHLDTAPPALIYVGIADRLAELGGADE